MTKEQKEEFLQYLENLKIIQTDDYLYREGIDMAISAIKGGWIPVSEENLPEDFQNVLVTIVRYNGEKVVRAAEYHEIPKLSRKTFRILENNERWEVGEKQLLAWMPKPEPYKGESEG